MAVASFADVGVDDVQNPPDKVASLDPRESRSLAVLFLYQVNETPLIELPVSVVEPFLTHVNFGFWVGAADTESRADVPITNPSDTKATDTFFNVFFPNISFPKISFPFHVDSRRDVPRHETSPDVNWARRTFRTR